MFKNETVFILGAGASWHYGYPTGEDLVKRVIQKSSFLSEQFRGHDIIYNIQPAFLKPYFSDEQPIWPKAWNNFSAKCLDLASRLREVDPPVIDHFLGHNPELHDIGKFMIAWIILECECAFERTFRNQNRVIPGKDNWYRFVLHQLLSECKSADDLEKNKVTFITFNYDVSLERYLYKGIKNIESVRTAVDTFFKNPRFLHIYGKVHENFESKFDKSISFKELDTALDIVRSGGFSEYIPFLDKIYKSSQTLQTVEYTDKDLNQPILEEARKKIRNAKCVYILGYGFDEKNSERIGLRLGGRISENGNSTHRVMFTNLENSNRINKKANKLFEGAEKNFLNDNKYTSGFIYSPPYYEKSIRNVYDALALDFDTLETYSFDDK